MKCFNHPEREAVATCQKCGKGLCKECAEKHTPCLCDSCAVQIQRDPRRPYRDAEPPDSAGSAAASPKQGRTAKAEIQERFG